jgi:YHS domain-containing protein
VFTIAKIKRVTPLSWEHKQINTAMFSNTAANGYDVVAYFTQNKAVEGNEEFSFNWKETDWLFSTIENKNLFAANPEQYAPQLGGFCGFATSKGFTANTDPNTFEVIDGKLFLFADENMRTNWKENQAENMEKCLNNWH